MFTSCVYNQSEAAFLSVKAINVFPYQ